MHLQKFLTDRDISWMDEEVPTDPPEFIVSTRPRYGFGARVLGTFDAMEDALLCYHRAPTEGVNQMIVELSQKLESGISKTIRRK